MEFVIAGFKWPGFFRRDDGKVADSGNSVMSSAAEFDDVIPIRNEEEHGNIIWSPEELKNIVTYANSKGILIHTHSYGDAACNATLDAYIASNEKNAGEYRNCLGHVRNIEKKDLIQS